MQNILYYKLIPLLWYCIMKQFEVEKGKERICEERSFYASNRRKKKRVKWHEVSERMGDYQFRRMFRMTKPCFEELCQTIIGKIGESHFKLEAYIGAFLKGNNLMYDAQEKTSGGYISGEIKLATTIRLLGGGDACDLAVIFDMYPSHISVIFREVLKNWIIKPNLGKINILKYLAIE